VKIGSEHPAKAGGSAVRARTVNGTGCAPTKISSKRRDFFIYDPIQKLFVFLTNTLLLSWVNNGFVRKLLNALRNKQQSVFLGRCLHL
jgi:hypothetical protein